MKKIMTGGTNMLKQRLAFLERALKSKQITPEQREDLLWERDCCKRTIENQNDREYVVRVAKLKAEYYLEGLK